VEYEFLRAVPVPSQFNALLTKVMKTFKNLDLSEDDFKVMLLLCETSRTIPQFYIKNGQKEFYFVEDSELNKEVANLVEQQPLLMQYRLLQKMVSSVHNLSLGYTTYYSLTEGFVLEGYGSEDHFNLEVKKIPYQRMEGGLDTTDLVEKQQLSRGIISDLDYLIR